MRLASIVGVVLVLLGLAVLVFDVSIPNSETLFEIGDVEASVTEQKAIPAWVGIVGLVVGLVLIAGGTAKRRS